MSITVKNISVSIKGILSEQFHIELQGSHFNMDGFSLWQNLLRPSSLLFTMHKDTVEDINDVQFNVCGFIIGAPVTLTLQTGSTEESMEGFEETDQNDTIEFEGFVKEANAYRGIDNSFSIQVECVSKYGAMVNAPNCYMYNDYALNEIVKELVTGEYKLQCEGKVAHKEDIHYTVQYNENDWEFLSRLAIRYGEWMYDTGKTLHFGQLENQESIHLTYPSQDLPEYHVSLKTAPVNYLMVNYLYNHRSAVNFYFGKVMPEYGHNLNDSTFNASKDVYTRRAIRMSQGSGLEYDADVSGFKPQKGSDEQAKLHGEHGMALQHSMRGNMVVYRGTTYCSKMKIGTKLTINDGYISGEKGEKSKVQQDEILITSVMHSFGVNDDYENNFEGVPSAVPYPPYYNPTVYPHCDHPVRAVVIDTEDPEKRERVRVRFPWQIKEYMEKHGAGKEKSGMTPWIHVRQPYTGANDKEGGFFGVHLIPEKASTVLVDFEEGNFERPYVVGAYFDYDYPVDPAWYPGANNVKALRTISGHTIEIHDSRTNDNAGDGGYIRIYDNKKKHYEVLLSVDKKLIKLRSVGNIELNAGNDIIMTAGKNIKMTAKQENVEITAVKKDIIERAGNDYDMSAGHNIYTSAGNDSGHTTGNNYWVTSDNEITLSAKKEAQMNSQEDMVLISGQTKVGVQTKDQGSGSIDFGTQLFRVSAKQKIQMQDAMDMEFTSSNGFKVYCATMEVNANATINFTATATIDIKAPIVNET